MAETRAKPIFLGIAVLNPPYTSVTTTILDAPGFSGTTPHALDVNATGTRVINLNEDRPVTFLTIDVGPYLNLRERAEKAGSNYLDRPMHIGKLSIVLRTGQFQIDDLLIASGVDPGQPPERLEKHDVGLGIVPGPGAAAAEPESAKTAAERRVA